MKLKSIYYFQSTYEQGSITAAARQCFVSQPSITAAISQLEQQLNVELLSVTLGVRPTSAADKLYPLAKEMSENKQNILNLFNDSPAPIPLRLGLMRSLGAQRMSELLTELTQRIDNIELTLVDPDEPCDARVILSQSTLSSEAFIPIWEDKYQIAIPINWPLAAKPLIEIADLDGLPFINRTPCDALDRLKQTMAIAGVRFQPRANIRTIEYTWPLVCAGIGAALLPEWQEIKHNRDLVLRPIAGEKLIKLIGLAYNTSRVSEPMMTAILSVCRGKL